MCLFSKKAHKMKTHKIMPINVENIRFYEGAGGGKSRLRSGMEQKFEKF